MTRFLEYPVIFYFWSWITGDIPLKKKIIQEHIRPFEGAKILDIGCGTGVLAQLINEVTPVSYTGFDSNPKYIEFAKKRKYPGVFNVGSVHNSFLSANDFDIVLAMDVMHHLNDEEAKAMLTLAKKCLKQNGRFILQDPVITKQQGFFEKQLMKLDRGKYIRRTEADEEFLREVFSEVKIDMLSNSYFIPWTECVFSCKWSE